MSSMDHSGAGEALSPDQSATVSSLLARITEGRNVDLADALAATWQSREMAQVAAAIFSSLASGSQLEDIERTDDRELRCLLRDRGGRPQELLLTFESNSSGRLTRQCLRPVLPEHVEVRPPGTDDLAAMMELELAAPVRRDDGTEVVIDHNGMQFEHARVVSDHRWLAAFQEGRMVAVQGVALATAPIGGAMCRLAYNHYSRSDPRTRQSGNLIHLVMSLYRDIFGVIDQFLSIVDVQNTAGLRLSFGTPWPTRVRRLFLSVEALAARRATSSPHATFDPEHAASLLNATHEGMNLWVPRTAAFLTERRNRAPLVYGPTTWQATDSAVLALWPSGERRTYRKDGVQTARTLALVLDYGFSGDTGREQLLDLLARGASQLVGRGISHLAIFISDDHPPTQWLMDLAEASDTYAVCSPLLNRAHPAQPTGPVYIDHIIF
jgi:hypothetical protein